MSKQLAKTKLNPAQEAFCREYAVVRNASAAYRKAYPNATAETSWVQSFRLLRNPNVRAKIRKLEESALERNGITQDMILQEFKALAFSRLPQAIGVPIDELHTLPDHVQATIKTAKRTDSPTGGYNETIEVHSKEGALTKLAEMAGLIKKDAEKGINIQGENIQVIFK